MSVGEHLSAEIPSETLYAIRRCQREQSESSRGLLFICARAEGIIPMDADYGMWSPDDLTDDNLDRYNAIAEKIVDLAPERLILYCNQLIESAISSGNNELASDIDDTIALTDARLTKFKDERRAQRTAERQKTLEARVEQAWRDYEASPRERKLQFLDGYFTGVLTPRTAREQQLHDTYRAMRIRDIYDDRKKSKTYQALATAIDIIHARPPVFKMLSGELQAKIRSQIAERFDDMMESSYHPDRVAARREITRCLDLGILTIDHDMELLERATS